MKKTQKNKQAGFAILEGLFILLVVGAIASIGVYMTFRSRAAVSANNFAVPDSIASDCSRDVTADLSSFIASVPNGTSSTANTVSFKQGGCYLVSSVQLDKRNDLVLAGNGATLQRKTAPGVDSGRINKSILYIAYSHGMTVRDLKIVGDNTGPDHKEPGNYYDFLVSREHEHALFIYGGDQPGGSENILISNFSTDSVYGDSVRLWGTRNVRIEKSHIYGAGRQGIAARSTDRLAIVDNRFDYLRRTAIDFEEDPVTNVRIERNHFESQVNNLGNFPGSHGADRNILVANNTANPGTSLGIRCTTPTEAVAIRDNQPAFKNTASAGRGPNDIPCDPAGFDESQLPPLENPFPNGSSSSGGGSGGGTQSPKDTKPPKVEPIETCKKKNAAEEAEKNKKAKDDDEKDKNKRTKDKKDKVCEETDKNLKDCKDKNKKEKDEKDKLAKTDKEKDDNKKDKDKKDKDCEDKESKNKERKLKEIDEDKDNR